VGAADVLNPAKLQLLFLRTTPMSIFANQFLLTAFDRAETRFTVEEGLGCGSLGMKARELIYGAPFEPETVEAMGQAFDEAWARIARMFGTDSDAIEAARIKLAAAMLSVASHGCTDVVALRADALSAMAKDYHSGL
jgi:hypothetical protein